MKYNDFLFKSGLRNVKETNALAKYLSETPYHAPAPIVKAAPDGVASLGEREALFVMTDSWVDREGDVIVSAGMDIDQFKEFGSILWGHRADKPEFVLGKPAEVMKEETRILVRASFLDSDANPTADRVLRMIQAGAVRAMSVGIMVGEFSEASDRAGYMPLNILRSELIETSVTPVPVNPRAVALAAGGSAEEAKELKDLFEEATDTQEQLEATAIVTGLTEDQVKALVLEAVKELKSPNLPTEKPEAQTDRLSVLDYLARSFAQYRS